jgi:hypothetical protein
MRTTSGVPHELLAVMESLNTGVLWEIIWRGAETQDVLLLGALNEKRQREGLTEGEEAVARDLIRQYDRAVLIRSKALALLHQRGEDVSDLLAGHESMLNITTSEPPNR